MPQTFPEYHPTVPHLLAYAAAHFARNECVVTPQGRLTYSELDLMSARLAARLVELGAGKGTRVGILFPNSLPWVIAWAAAARIGAVTIPVNTFYKTPELATFLRHSDVQLLVGTGRFIQHDYLERLESIAPDLADHDGPPLYLERLPALRRVVLWADPDPDPDGHGEAARGWAEVGLEAAARSQPDARVAAVVKGLEEEVSPDDDLFITYTSGSTGEPKGVVHSHGGVIRHARNLAALSGMDATTRVWTPMPLCWVGGFSYTMLRAMTVGACFLTQEVFDPGAALAMIEQERVSNVAAWPGIAKTLMEHPDWSKTDTSSVVAGSFYEAFPPDRRPPDPSLAVTSLGMSETCGPHTFWLPEEEIKGSPEQYRNTFGHEVPGVSHRIIDSDTGEDVAEGEEGEVLVRGYSLMKGMYKRERAEVFDADGWYHTGDRGLFRDGWFFFTGRQTDLIKTKGSNVAPAEVEKVLLAVPAIKQAYVVGVDHPDRGQDVVALVVPWADGPEVDPEAVRRYLAEQLSSYKVPRHVLVLSDSDVPWLVSQKVDRRALGRLAAGLVAGQSGSP